MITLAWSDFGFITGIPTSCEEFLVAFRQLFARSLAGVVVHFIQKKTGQRKTI